MGGMRRNKSKKSDKNYAKTFDDEENSFYSHHYASLDAHPTHDDSWKPDFHHE